MVLRSENCVQICARKTILPSMGQNMGFWASNTNGLKTKVVTHKKIIQMKSKPHSHGKRYDLPKLTRALKPS